MEHLRASELHGCMVALITPMHTNGDINYEQWNALIKWHIKCGTKALVVGGTTGESALLMTDELEQLIEMAVTLCSTSDTKVIVGTGHIDSKLVIENNKRAQQLNADAVLVVTPYYLTLTQHALENHFKLIADHSEIPIILYNVPSRTGNDLSADSCAKLALHPHIIGIKEAKADMSRIRKLVGIKGFAVLSGDDDSFVEAMALGANGVISVAANTNPLSIKSICDHLELGHTVEAKQLDADLKPLYQLLFSEPNPCPVKALMHAANIITDGIRKPLELTKLNRTQINQQLKSTIQEFNHI